jgi:hypothetical protein
MAGVKNKFSAECLISEVQYRPILWQDNHIEYKNKYVTNKIWEEVGKVCNCTGKLMCILYNTLQM